MRSADDAIAASDVSPRGARRKLDRAPSITLYLYEDGEAFVHAERVGVSRLTRKDLERIVSMGIGWEPIMKVGA